MYAINSFFVSNRCTHSSYSNKLGLPEDGESSWYIISPHWSPNENGIVLISLYLALPNRIVMVISNHKSIRQYRGFRFKMAVREWKQAFKTIRRRPIASWKWKKSGKAEEIHKFYLTFCGRWSDHSEFYRWPQREWITATIFSVQIDSYALNTKRSAAVDSGNPFFLGITSYFFSLHCTGTQRRCAFVETFRLAIGNRATIQNVESIHIPPIIRTVV